MEWRSIVFYVYQLRTTECNKFYIGVTNDPDRRFKQHMSQEKRKWKDLTKCGRAVKRYGAHTFSMRILERCENDSTAKRLEKVWIKRIGKRRLWNSNRGG